MLKVTIDVFSGLENPSWILDEQESREVLRDITVSRGVIAEVDSGYDGLGYRGIQVELLNDEAVEQFDLPSAFRIANGASLYESKGLEIAERLITRMPGEGAINLLTESPLAFNEGLQQQLLDNLGIFPAARYNSIEDPTLPRELNAEMMAVSSRCSIEVGKFNPGFWNLPDFVRKNNCYNYATNRRTNTFAQPGRATGKYPYPMQCVNVSNAALSDGLHKQYDCFPGTEQPRYFVALVVAPGVDYHWYRYQADGFWGHKPGGTPAKNVDNSGKIVYSPEACDRTSGWPSYTQFCGYLYTAKSIKVN